MVDKPAAATTAWNVFIKFEMMGGGERNKINYYTS